MVDEQIEGVVDCCETDALRGLFDGLVEFFGGGVCFGITECFVDEQARARATDTALSEDGADGVLAR